MKQISYKLDNDELQEAINKACEHHINCSNGTKMIERYLEEPLRIQCERARITIVQ